MFTFLKSIVGEQDEFLKSVCRNCVYNLDAFHQFYNQVAINYGIQETLEVIETKNNVKFVLSEGFQEEEMVNTSELDEYGKGFEHELIKVEALDEIETTMEPEWIEQKDEDLPETIIPLKTSRNDSTKRNPNLNIDSADDQRIRETAQMACELCSEKLDSLRDAKAHFKSLHFPLEGYLICCERKFRQRCRLVEHVNTHFNYTYPCPLCNKTFDSRSYLQKHMAIHQDNKEYVSSTMLL